MKSTTVTKKLNSWYYFTLFMLALATLVITVIPYFFSFSPFWQKSLSLTGTVIYAIFFVDFIYFWYKAQWERKYLRDNWISLVAILLPLQGLKALKGLKGLKALKSVKVLKVVKLSKKVKSKS
ncbi:MAG: ion transporter [Thermincolia bacterium]